MKRFTLILVLVVLISLTLVIPVFAGGGDQGKACENMWVGMAKGAHVQYSKFGLYQGRFYGVGSNWIHHDCP